MADEKKKSVLRTFWPYILGFVIWLGLLILSLTYPVPGLAAALIGGPVVGTLIFTGVFLSIWFLRAFLKNKDEIGSVVKTVLMAAIATTALFLLSYYVMPLLMAKLITAHTGGFLGSMAFKIIMAVFSAASTFFGMLYKNETIKNALKTDAAGVVLRVLGAIVGVGGAVALGMLNAGFIAIRYFPITPIHSKAILVIVSPGLVPIAPILLALTIAIGFLVMSGLPERVAKFLKEAPKKPEGIEMGNFAADKPGAVPTPANNFSSTPKATPPMPGGSNNATPPVPGQPSWTGAGQPPGGAPLPPPQHTGTA
jgi:hypothetical protein